MKFFNVLTFVVLCVVFTGFSCSDNTSSRQTIPSAPAPYATPSYAAPSTATVNPSEPHYKCTNNCEGGVGDAAGNCPVCGSTMAHNQAYHNQGTTTTPVTPTTPTTSPVQATSPAQNASGQFHYICSNGCSGGAAGAGNCATCGNALTHNQAYHN